MCPSWGCPTRCVPVPGCCGAYRLLPRRFSSSSLLPVFVSVHVYVVPVCPVCCALPLSLPPTPLPISHVLTDSLMHSLTDSLMHSLMHSFTHLLNHSSSSSSSSFSSRLFPHHSTQGVSASGEGLHRQHPLAAPTKPGTMSPSELGTTPAGSDTTGGADAVAAGGSGGAGGHASLPLEEELMEHTVWPEVKKMYGHG